MFTKGPGVYALSWLGLVGIRFKRSTQTQIGEAGFQGGCLVVVLGLHKILILNYKIHVNPGIQIKLRHRNKIFNTT